MTTPIKPFSTYPETREEMLRLCATVEREAPEAHIHNAFCENDAEAFEKAAIALADLVSGIADATAPAIVWRRMDQITLQKLST